MTENELTDLKSSLVIRVPLSADGYVSIYFASDDGRLMNEREWWHLKQVVELASTVCAKQEAKPQAAAIAAAAAAGE